MECIYLIGTHEKSLYKIGVTEEKEIKTRLRNIQVGCPYKIEIIDSFPTPYAYKVEKILHRSLVCEKTDGDGVSLHGEWFYLGLVDVYKFQEKCLLSETNYKIIENL